MLKNFLLPLALLFALAACSPPSPQQNPSAVPSPLASGAAASSVSQAATQPASASTAAPTQAGAGTPVPVTGDDIRAFVIIPEESRASYEVGEVFINQNNRFSIAIGTTNAVTGEVYLNFTHPEQSTMSEITVDISKLASDSSRRDEQIRWNWLESAQFPIATFKPTSIEGLPQQYSMGSEITFKVTGNMTIRDTSRRVTFDVTARLENDRLTGTAATEILMTDFGFQPPDIAGILKAEDKAVIKLEFVAEPE